MGIAFVFARSNRKIGSRSKDSTYVLHTTKIHDLAGHNANTTLQILTLTQIARENKDTFRKQTTDKQCKKTTQNPKNMTCKYVI